MRMLFCALVFFFCTSAFAQTNFAFDFSGAGQRVCLADVTVTLSPASVTIHFLDASANTSQATNVYRRHLYGRGTDWVMVANALPAGTTSWTDTNVASGDVWEYQIKRTHGATFSTGYVAATIGGDQTNYRGRMILLVADNIVSSLSAKYIELKKDLTGDGWFVQELIVPKATSWDSGDRVVTIRGQIQSIYNAAPANDKPKQLFILGHVPLPRAGLGGQTPDDHIQNTGARGADTYYADVDGIFTDAGTYNPGGLSSPFAINLPGDYKWDQDNIPSELEMAFGRIDFTDIQAYPQTETVLTDQYLTRLHHYKQVDAGFNMGTKTGFYFGYDNSNDGSYRSLPAISGGNNVVQNTTALPHPQWVQQNGPFSIYMQNVQAPQTGEWDTYGMNAAVYTSDQSYWGFGDVPEGNQYSKIRSILCANTKCVMVIWTTMAINLFHQPGAGESMGMACKQIMDHNTTNQKLEKPSSPYDTPAFWNRTQFELYGDPTIRLQQVIPATAPILSVTGATNISLQWTASADNNIVGYHIYKSASEFGIFTKISGSTPVTATSYINNNATAGEWYMIRAVKLQTTGSGIFYNPSQGVFIKNTLSVVPVTVSGFEATKVKQTALLHWKTATEFNSKGFGIEKSNDGINWKEIANLNSLATAGNSNIILDYSYTDAHPFTGNNFYRLRQISFSGENKFSEIRKLFFDKEDEFTFSPNPVTNIFTINNTGNIPVKSVELFDEKGMQVYKSITNISFVNMGTFTKGIYILRITGLNKKVYQQKIIKQ